VEVRRSTGSSTTSRANAWRSRSIGRYRVPVWCVCSSALPVISQLSTGIARTAVATKHETMRLPQSRRPYHAPHLRAPRMASAILRKAEGRSRLLQCSPGRRFAALCDRVAMEHPERAQSMREWSPARSQARSGRQHRAHVSLARAPRESIRSRLAGSVHLHSHVSCRVADRRDSREIRQVLR
jgi:hypothetical protein